MKTQPDEDIRIEAAKRALGGLAERAWITVEQGQVRIRLKATWMDIETPSSFGKSGKRQKPTFQLGLDI